MITIITVIGGLLAFSALLCWAVLTISRVMDGPTPSGDGLDHRGETHALKMLMLFMILALPCFGEQRIVLVDLEKSLTPINDLLTDGWTVAQQRVADCHGTIYLVVTLDSPVRRFEEKEQLQNVQLEKETARLKRLIEQKRIENLRDKKQ